MRLRENGTWHLAPVFIALFLMTTCLSAQPKRLWQRHGVPNGSTQLVVEPTSGVMAFTTGTDERSTLMIRFPDGEVQTRQLFGPEPKMQFIDEQTLLLFSPEFVAEYNINTRRITRQHRWTLATFVGENFLPPEFVLSADGEEALINVTVDAKPMEERWLRVNTRTMELLDDFWTSQWDLKATFRAPTTDYLLYDHNEVYLNGKERMMFPSGHRILTLQSMNERCWVLHHDSATKALWLSLIRLDSAVFVEQRKMIDSTAHWISREIRIDDGHLIVALERDVYVLDPTTLETRTHITDAVYPSTVDVSANGGYYLNRSRELIELDAALQPADTLAHLSHSLQSITQDRRGRVLVAQQRLKELDPLTGMTRPVAAGSFTPADDYATDFILADPSSDRFAMMVTTGFTTNTLYFFDGPERETLQFILYIGAVPDPSFFSFEPLWKPQFIPGTSDVIVASSCSEVIHFNMIERFTPTSDTLAPLRTNVRKLDAHLGVRFISNTDATRFVFGTTWQSPLHHLGDFDVEIPTATTAIYHPASASFIMDHPQGVQLFSDDEWNTSPPTELGERMIPLCASANRPFVLGWLDSTSRIALFNVETSSIIWRNTPSARPTAAYLDEGGRWFVISYEMGVTEGYAIDSMSVSRPDTPRPLVQVAPNPSLSVIDLQTIDELRSVDGWQIFDRNGILVLSGIGTSVDITSLSSGSYSALVRSGAEYLRTSFVVMR